MMYPGLKKWISLFILFAFLANQCSPLYAAPKTKSGLKKQVGQRAQQAKQNAPDYWVQKATELAKDNCDVGGVKCALDFLEKAEGNPKANVCVPASKHDTKNKVCMEAQYFAYGAIHAAVSDPKNPWLYYNYRQKKFLGKTTGVRETDWYAVRESAHNVFKLVSRWGIYYKSDVDALTKYFKEIATGGKCGKGDGDCGSEMIALIGLAFLSQGRGPNARKFARETATKILTSKWKSKDGGSVLKGAIIALAVLDTEASWKDIETFLTSTSLPNPAKEVLNLMTVETLTEAGIHLASAGRSGVTRYYNSSNRQFTYLDTLASNQQGLKHPYNNPALQYPHNNVFEEIGYFIGEQAAKCKKCKAKELAQKIMRSAIAYAEYKSAKTATPKKASANPRPVTTGGAAPVWAPTPQTNQFEIYGGHWPLVVGIMNGAAKNPASIAPGDTGIIGVMHLIKEVFVPGFWDTNAGTYLRVFNIAMTYGNARVGSAKFRFMTTKSEGYIAAKKHYSKIQPKKELAGYIDKAIMVVSTVAFVASLPELYRSVCKAANWLKGQMKLLKNKVLAATQAAAEATETATIAAGQVLDSAALKELYTAKNPLFQGATETYVKVAPIEAKVAAGGEKIATVVKGGLVETVNVANPGDIILTNPGGEQYILSFEKFTDRYELAAELGEGWYRPKVIKQSFVQISQDVDIMASWGKVEHVKKGGFLNVTDLDNIYGVAEHEFYQTYQKVSTGLQGASGMPKAFKLDGLLKGGRIAPKIEVKPNMFRQTIQPYKKAG